MMSDMSTDSDDTSLTDWSIVDKDGHMDDSDSLSTASSTEVLEDDEEIETATPIHHRNSIGVGPVFILRLSSRESAKRDPKSEGDATPIVSADVASIELCSKLSSDITELQEDPNAKNNEMDSPTPRSRSIKGSNSFLTDDPYQVEEILPCTAGNNEGQGGRETVDFIETAAIESIGSLNERQINLPDFLALDPKTFPKMGDEVKPLTRMMLETEPQTKAKTQHLTEDMTEACREIRTECVNKTKIGLQTEIRTEAKNTTSNMLIRLNRLSEFTEKTWSWVLGYLNGGLVESIRNHLLHLLLFVMILTLGIIIGFIVASKQLKVHEEQEISPSVEHNDLQKCQKMEKETEKNKPTSIPPSDMQSNSDGKSFGKLELQKEEKPDLKSEYDHLVEDRPCHILIKEHCSLEEQDHVERGVCYRQIHKVESQSSHGEMEKTKLKPLVQDQVQPNGVKSHKALIDMDFLKSQIAAVKEHNEKNETNNAHGSYENVNVIVEKLGDNAVTKVDVLDTEVDEYEIEDSTDLNEEENHEDNFNFGDIDYDHEDDNVDDDDDDDDDDIDNDHDDDDDDEAYIEEEVSFDRYGSTYNYKPDSSKANLDANRDGAEGHQTGRKFDNDHKSGFDSSNSNSPDPKQVKLKLETGARQEEGNTRYDKRDNSKEASGERENKWMNTVLDMWNKTRATVTNVTNQIKETWQQVKNLSVDLWEKNQPYVEKLQQHLGSTVEKASWSLQKKFQKATQKIKKVTRRWFRSKDSNADVAEDESYQEDTVHLGHAKTSRRPFQEEVKKDGGPKATKQEKKIDEVDQLPLKNARARKQKLDGNHFDKMGKSTPQHNHDTKFDNGYGDCQRGRRHDTAQEHCGGHSKHAEKKFKRSCKKNVYILFRDVNKVNRVDLSRSMNLHDGDQIFDSFSKFKDKFALDALTDEIRTWFMCQSDFWAIWGKWYNNGHYHSSMRGIRDVKCMPYLKCWQIKEMDPTYFNAQKCQKGDFRRKMKKLLKNPCVDYQPEEYGRTVNPAWEPIDKPQMPHRVKNDDFSEIKRKKKQTDLHMVRNLQSGNKNKDVSDSMDDKKKNIEGDWYLQLASEREYSRTKADDWYLRRFERSHENLDGEHKVKQESAWLFERAAKRQNLRVYK